MNEYKEDKKRKVQEKNYICWNRQFFYGSRTWRQAFYLCDVSKFVTILVSVDLVTRPSVLAVFFPSMWNLCDDVTMVEMRVLLISCLSLVLALNCWLINFIYVLRRISQCRVLGCSGFFYSLPSFFFLACLWVRFIFFFFLKFKNAQWSLKNRVC